MAKKGKQLKIAGTERKDRNAAIEKAAAAYVEVRDERMALTKQEVDLQTKLVIEMKAAKLTKYACDDDTGLVVELLASKEKAKVKTLRDDPDEIEE